MKSKLRIASWARLPAIAVAAIGCGGPADDQSEPIDESALANETLTDPVTSGEAAAAEDGVATAAAPPQMSWQRVAGGGSDIAGTNDGAWVIGTDAYGGTGNFRVHRWLDSESRWQASDRGGARIDAGSCDCRPWLVNYAGQVWHKTTCSPTGGWETRSSWGCAKDIGVGDSCNGLPRADAIWIIGCDRVGTAGNYAIYEIRDNQRIQAAGGAVKIGVGDDRVPWVVTAAGTVYRRTSTSASSGTWEQMSASGRAYDIAPDTGRNTLIIGRSSTTGGFRVEVLHNGAWAYTGGAGFHISSGWYAWLTNEDRRIYRGSFYGFP